MTWKLQLIRPEATIKKSINVNWQETMIDIVPWIETKLFPAMVHGGLGIKGIADTPFYKFITSPEGLSQLGIEKDQPPKLLEAYKTKAFKVIQRGRSIRIQFGDVAQLKLATPHPASGTGFLQIKSWLEWIVDAKTVGSGFVPRNRIPGNAKKKIRLGSPLGGLMLRRGVFGSSGLWRFPSSLLNYEDDWFKENIKAIQDAITKRITEVFVNKLR
jgi:hypothetical protein